jgi:hypothetical protein
MVCFEAVPLLPVAAQTSTKSLRPDTVYHGPRSSVLPIGIEIRRSVGRRGMAVSGSDFFAYLADLHEGHGSSHNIQSPACM